MRDSTEGSIPESLGNFNEKFFIWIFQTEQFPVFPTLQLISNLLAEAYPGSRVPIIANNYRLTFLSRQGLFRTRNSEAGRKM